VVYRGGLENRFGRKPNGGSNPSLSASLRSERNRERKLSGRFAERESGLKRRFGSVLRGATRQASCEVNFEANL
jgi:hypothetical protein